MKTLLILALLALGAAVGYHYYIAPQATITTDDDGVESIAFKESVRRSQANAVKEYPDLGKLNSKFNVRFRSGLTEWRRVKDPRLQHSNWPMKLATEIAGQPADIILDMGGGRVLHFNTMEQKNAYMDGLERTRAASLNSPAPRPTTFGNDALRIEKLRAGSTR